MKQDEVNELLKEAIESEGFLNLDQNDIEKLKNDVDSVDAIKVVVKTNKLVIYFLKQFQHWKKQTERKSLENYSLLSGSLLKTNF